MSQDALSGFHPAVAGWFRGRFPGGPTEAQDRAWAATAQHRDAPVAAVSQLSMTAAPHP